jgi:hypothetical protein
MSWYETHENLVMLATMLDDDGRFAETADVVRYLEKPWKWTDEWERWEAAGKPATFNFDEPEGDPALGVDWEEARHR